MGAVAQTSGYALGTEYGIYAITSPGKTRSSGPAGTCMGIIANHFPNNKLAIYSGIYISEQFTGVTFYRIPLRAAYTLGRRNVTCFDKRNNNGYGTATPPRRGTSTDILDLLLLRFVPRTLEIEGGLSMGYYSKKTSETYEETTTTIVDFGNGNYSFVRESIRSENSNIQFVPTIDLGVRWWYKVWNFRLYVHPTYSYMPWGDNKTTRTNLDTQKIEHLTSHSSFTVTGGLMYVWDYE